MEHKNQLKSDWQESFTVQQLKDAAKTFGLKNYSKLKKKDLIDLIKNSIYLPTIVDIRSEDKLKTLEKEVEKLRLKCQQQEERERIEKEKIEKKDILEKEKYRRVIQKYNNRRWGENFSEEEQKIMEIITGLRFYMANCRDRQLLIDYCKEKNYPVPDINGNF